MKTHQSTARQPDGSQTGVSKEFIVLLIIMVFGILIIAVKAMGLI